MTHSRTCQFTRRGLLGRLAAASVVPLVPSQASAEPHSASADTAPQDSLVAPRFRVHRGVSLYPWFDQAIGLAAPSPRYSWPPFPTNRPQPRPSDFVRLRDAGVDFVRLPFDPGPFLAFSGDHREQLLTDLVHAVAEVTGAGLSVILTVHPNDGSTYWSAKRLVGLIGNSEFDRYLDLMHTLAGRLTGFDNTRLALEIFNEPPPMDGGIGNWPKMQARAVDVVRDSAPKLTIVASPGYGSLVEGLEAFDPIGVTDPDILYNFHFYEPYIFTHQGATWMYSEPMYRYLSDVPWPASAGSKTRALKASAARLASLGTTTPALRGEIWKAIQTALTGYFEGMPDRDYLKTWFERVANWAKSKGVSTDRIVLAEFGALRSDRQYAGARADDRARYLTDVRELAEAYGMPWAFWNYFGSMGLVVDDTSRAFDPKVVAALGLHMPGA